MTSKLARYREAVVTYYSSAHRPYRELVTSAIPLPARLHGQPNGAVVDASAFITQHLHVLVIGGPGTGKTSLFDRCSHLLAASGEGTPIFVPLRRYVSDLLDLITTQIHRFVPGLDPSELLYESTNVTLLLDGLDEIAPPLREKATHDIQQFAARWPIARTLISSRPTVDLSAWSSWEHLELLPLSDAEVHRMLSAIASEQAIQEIFSQPRLLEIARRPLFLHTIAEASTITDDLRQFLLDAATGYFAWRGHARSNLPLEVPVEAISRALEILAMEMIKKATPWLDSKYASTLLAADRMLARWDIASAVFDTDVITGGGDDVRFTHVSLLEAYAAKFLRTTLRLGDMTPSDLRSVLDSQHGANILSTLFHLLSSEERARFVRNLSITALADVMRLIPAQLAEHVQSTGAPTGSPLIVDALEAASRAERRGRARKDIIVFAVHGFNTRGEWKNTLATLLNLETDGIRFIYAPWDYGVFRSGILNPLARRRKVNEFQLYYNRILDTYGVDRPEVCAVAHSFGTYIIGRSMLLFDEIRFDRIILLRSVLPRRFPWNRIVGKCDLVLNVCGGSDRVLIAAQAVPGLGASGRFGFNSTTEFVIERLNEFGEHSTVFGSRHIRERWIPFLRDGSV